MKNRTTPAPRMIENGTRFQVGKIHLDLSIDGEKGSFYPPCFEPFSKAIPGSFENKIAEICSDNSKLRLAIEARLMAFYRRILGDDILNNIIRKFKPSTRDEIVFLIISEFENLLKINPNRRILQTMIRIMLRSRLKGMTDCPV